MIKKSLVICISWALAISVATAGDVPASKAELSAADIVDKTVAARALIVIATVCFETSSNPFLRQ
jgi:hypothetical protein